MPYDRENGKPTYTCSYKVSWNLNTCKEDTKYYGMISAWMFNKSEKNSTDFKVSFFKHSADINNWSKQIFWLYDPSWFT